MSGNNNLSEVHRIYTPLPGDGELANLTTPVQMVEIRQTLQADGIVTAHVACSRFI